MLSCSNCDASLKLNAKLCIKCGHIVTDEERELALTGAPIKKSIPVSEGIEQEAVIQESMSPEDEKQAISTSAEPVVIEHVAEIPAIAIEDSVKPVMTPISEIAESKNVNSSEIQSKGFAEPEHQLESVNVNDSPANETTKAKESVLIDEKKANNAQLPSTSNSKLIGIGIAGLIVVGSSAFFLMGGDKGAKAPIANVPPVIAPTVSESQPAAAPATPPPVAPEPIVTQTAKPAPAQPIQKPKPSSQQGEAPVAMPDLNKLVKDAINK